MERNSIKKDHIETDGRTICTSSQKPNTGIMHIIKIAWMKGEPTMKTMVILGKKS